MPIDDPDEDNPLRRIFEINRILEAHWDKAADEIWRAGGCLECEGRNNCRQLDWALEKWSELASVMLQKG
ncbi:hypothetical protein [Micromonospora sp. NPDC003241]